MIVYEKDGEDFLLMSNNRHGVMKIPTAGFGMAPALTDAVANGETAGVVHERISGMQGVEQLDLLDDRRDRFDSRPDVEEIDVDARLEALKRAMRKKD